MSAFIINIIGDDEMSVMYFSELIPAQLHLKRPNVKDELKKMSSLLKRIAHCRLDKSEYDWLKSALLFRTGK